MFRVSTGSFEDAVGFLEDASSAADNIAYRTDLLLADFRPLAEGSFADASAEAGTEVGVKAKLLSLSLFALLETMRAASAALSDVMELRKGVLEAAGTGRVTDPVLDADINVEGSAEAASASARDVVARLEEAEGLLAGIHFPGGVADSLDYAISWVAKQGSYADSAAEAYVAYKGGVESFEAEFAPLFDEDSFLQVDSTLEWCRTEASSGGAGIGALLGAPGAIGDGMGWTSPRVRYWAFHGPWMATRRSSFRPGARSGPSGPTVPERCRRRSVMKGRSRALSLPWKPISRRTAATSLQP